MPTYRFKCDCGEEWEEKQPLLLDGTRHKSTCFVCGTVCESVPTGGTGVLMKGRKFDKYIEGFPDFTRDKNKKADIEGEELQKKHDAYKDEKMRKHPNG